MAGETSYKNRWLAENKERINLVVGKGDRQKFREHAEIQNESLNGFVLRAIHETIDRDNNARDNEEV